MFKGIIKRFLRIVDKLVGKSLAHTVNILCLQAVVRHMPELIDFGKNQILTKLSLTVVIRNH